MGVPVWFVVVFAVALATVVAVAAAVAIRRRRQARVARAPAYDRAADNEAGPAGAGDGAAGGGSGAGAARTVGAGGIEREYRFLDVEPAEVRARLEGLGAELVHPRRLYRRAVYVLPPDPRTGEARRGFARVRDETGGEKDGSGGAVTMTVKVYPDAGASGAHDPVETEVALAPGESFDAACDFVDQLCARKAYQETYREKWRLPDGVRLPGGGDLPACGEIAIDELPALRPYLEVDCGGDDPAAIDAVAAALGYDPAESVHGSFGRVYEKKYGVPQAALNDATPLLTFGAPALAEFRKHATANLEEFDAVAAAQAQDIA